MKLIIQIPCFNEEHTLAATVGDLPRTVAGFDAVEYLVVDDGSTDGTVAAARACGVHHVVRLPRNRGLAFAFAAGLDAALRRGADAVVNTDGDNQYRGEDVAPLVAPILEGRADMVIGTRPIGEIADFSPLKKLLQRLGSATVSLLAGARVPDAASGFRAFSREAAKRLLVTSRFSYTLETIIQAPTKGLAIACVPIRTNPATRPSRLFRSTVTFLLRSAGTIGRVFVVYRPFAFFSTLGALLFAPGVALGARFIYFFAMGEGRGHIQSLILAAVLLLGGFQLFLTGLLAHLSATNRRLAEELLVRVRTLELERSQE
ncbi:MAG TPA: glycosyltransferase family 2 protein [Acidobacteriota bacterium]|jgi:glycosyltransferase involved in cell wall biosynthesis|nr:glycosyltransferase family 2 protein [Acidobacteriota bacterium]HNR40540.1 glycosyltransferase family 2 protein [Acidobacteriota bacterium]HNU02461.1 glycosyltransferase family 2 protein [Acidobacteriota bacterium]